MAVNETITDAVTQTNVKVVGESPAQAMGLTYQAHSHSTGIEMENAATVQNSMQQVTTSATSACCTMIVKAGA